jgi:hypothetical protein
VWTLIVGLFLRIEAWKPSSPPLRFGHSAMRCFGEGYRSLSRQEIFKLTATVTVTAVTGLITIALGFAVFRRKQLTAWSLLVLGCIAMARSVFRKGRYHSLNSSYRSRDLGHPCSIIVSGAKSSSPLRVKDVQSPQMYAPEIPTLKVRCCSTSSASKDKSNNSDLANRNSTQQKSALLRLPRPIARFAHHRNTGGESAT